MSLLIRFEDTYGMFTMYSHLKNIGESLEVIHCNFYYAKSIDTYIEIGLNNTGVLTITRKGVLKYSSLGINKIIMVFDMDSDKSNNLLVSSEDVYDKLRKTIDAVNDTISIVLIPVVYTAETIALYQNCNLNQPLTELVNKENTKILHVNLLKLTFNLSFKNTVKKFDFINYKTLREKLEYYRSIDKLNRVAINFLLDYDYVGYNCKEIIEFLDKLNIYYNRIIDEGEGLDVMHNGILLRTFTNEYKETLKSLGIVNISS